LVYDENSVLTEADRKLKNDTVEKCYDMTQQFAYLVSEGDRYTSEAIATKNKKLAEKLIQLKKTLVVTTGDGYTATAPPELREKMAALYSKIEINYDKPSDSDLENLMIISEKFESSKSNFEKS